MLSILNPGKAFEVIFRRVYHSCPFSYSVGFPSVRTRSCNIAFPIGDDGLEGVGGRERCKSVLG